jgi:transposase
LLGWLLERLDAWIEAVQEKGIPELQHFVTGILKDKDAVVAGLTLVHTYTRRITKAIQKALLDL